MSKLISLTQGKFAIVDDADYEWLNQWKWGISSTGYAKRGIRKGKKTITIFLHRLLAKTPKGKFTDHINRNRLDNRRENLRVCTTFESNQNRGFNSSNTSGYKGVFLGSYSKLKKKWRVDIQQKTIGYFKTKEEAAIAYNKRAKELFGEHAWLNNI